MADRFNGTVSLGGPITQEQYERCLELIELEMEPCLDDNGSAPFQDCTKEDFAALVKYCEEQKIALMLEWDGDDIIVDFVEYWIDGKHQQFNTDSFGRIAISVSDLKAKAKEAPQMTIEKYVDAMDIPEFPELQIIRARSRTIQAKIAIAKEVLEFVCKTVSDAESVGAEALASEAPKIYRRCIEAIELIRRA
jgi:hypothetical protein